MLSRRLPAALALAALAFFAITSTAQACALGQGKNAGSGRITHIKGGKSQPPQSMNHRRGWRGRPGIHPAFAYGPRPGFGRSGPWMRPYGRSYAPYGRSYAPYGRYPHPYAMGPGWGPRSNSQALNGPWKRRLQARQNLIQARRVLMQQRMARQQNERRRRLAMNRQIMRGSSLGPTPRSPQMQRLSGPPPQAPGRALMNAPPPPPQAQPAPPMAPSPEPPPPEPAPAAPTEGEAPPISEDASPAAPTVEEQAQPFIEKPSPAPT